MATFLDRLGRLAFRRRWIVVVMWVVVLGIVGFASTQAGDAPDDTGSMPGIEAQNAYDLLGARFPGNGDSAGNATAKIVFVAPSGQKVTATDARQVIETVTAEAGEGSQVAGAVSPFQAGSVSPDGSTAYVTVAYTAKSKDLTDATRQQLRDAVEAARQAGLTVDVAGPVLAEQPSGGTTELLGIVIAAVVLLIMFGSLAAAGLPLLTALVGVGISLVSIMALGAVFGLSTTSSSLASMLGLAVGIDYALFVGPKEVPTADRNALSSETRTRDEVSVEVPRLGWMLIPGAQVVAAPRTGRFDDRGAVGYGAACSHLSGIAAGVIVIQRTRQRVGLSRGNSANKVPRRCRLLTPVLLSLRSGILPWLRHQHRVSRRGLSPPGKATIMRIAGNTVLVTGGSSGIGRALAEALHDRGNRVVVTGRRQALLDEITEQRPSIVGLPLELSDPASLRRVAEDVRARFPELNVLIANAGISRPEDIAADHWDIADAEAIVETNILGVIRTTAAFLPMLRDRQDATIIATGSALAFVPLAGFPAYCASKAFLHSWLTSLRHQLREVPVEVIELLPPYVRTELTGAQQAADPRAMPIDDYVTQVMHVLEQGDGGEILLERDIARRWAERDGTYDAIFAAMNPR